MPVPRPAWKAILLNQSDKIDNNGMNALRASVLTANDDIVSISGLLVGMAAVVPSALLIAGLSALIAGAFSMTGGEYPSIAAQRDAERAVGVNEANPWRAATSLFLSFTVGGLIPILIALSIHWLACRAVHQNVRHGNRETDYTQCVHRNAGNGIRMLDENIRTHDMIVIIHVSYRFFINMHNISL